MAESKTTRSSKELWAEFRFGIIGALLSSPPERGQLRRTLRELAGRTWRHPLTNEPTSYGVATIERWFYRSREERGSIVQALRRKARLDVGRSRVLDETIKSLLRTQHREHPSWSYRLHADNLAAEIEGQKLSEKTPSSGHGAAVDAGEWLVQDGSLPWKEPGRRLGGTRSSRGDGGAEL